MSAAIRQRINHAANQFMDWWHEYWLLRWVLANMVGWSAALLVAALCLKWLGLWGALIGGAAAGSIAGVLQSIALRSGQPPLASQRHWIILSLVGGLLATIPVYLLGFVALLHIYGGLFLMGACFGGIIGALQSRLLVDDYDDAMFIWIGANILAGGLCAPLTLTPTFLPLIGTLGPVTFGIITGMSLLYLQRPYQFDVPRKSND